MLECARFDIPTPEWFSEPPAFFFDIFQSGMYLHGGHHDRLHTLADEKLDFLYGVIIVRTYHGEENAFAVGRNRQDFIVLHFFERKQIDYRRLYLQLEEICRGKTELHAEQFLKVFHLQVSQFKENRTEMTSALCLDFQCLVQFVFRDEPAGDQHFPNLPVL